MVNVKSALSYCGKDTEFTKPVYGILFDTKRFENLLFLPFD